MLTGAGAIDIRRATAQTFLGGKRLLNSFKKAAWITSTTVLVLLVPLIIELDREQQILDMEKEHLNVLTAPAAK